MQLIDSADPRPAYVQVAASIRAAIQSGELEPGEKLATQDELAEYFHTSKVTLAGAMRVLREEGYVRSLPGGGVWVRDQARMPLPEDATHPLAGVADYAYEMGQLKRTPRMGWLLLNIGNVESVAEHSFRAAIFGLVLASMESADIGRTTALCVLHDAAETRISDITSVTRPYLTTTKTPEAISVDQTERMPTDTATEIRDLVSEFEDGKTLEAKCAKDADKLELLAQAREYETQGYDTGEWQATSIEAVRTETGKLLAQAILNTHPHEWRKLLAASYHENKADAKRRAKIREQGYDNA
jgi:putative hydrolase of HD superfamily